MTLWNRFFCVGPCFVEFCCHLQNCFALSLACLSLNLFEFMSLKCIVEKRTRKLLCTYKCMHMALLQEGHRILARFSTANDVLLACSSPVFWLVYR